MADLRTGILIVGGGPVGLGLALDLAWRGQPSMLVERDPKTAPVLLAKANGLHERTIETCRRWGILNKVIERGFPQDLPGDSVYCTSLTGHFLGRSVIQSTLERPQPPQTPVKRQRCPQYEFDPILAEEVQRRGLTDIRYGQELIDFEEDETGVTATLKAPEMGDITTVRCNYMVACDGAGSLARRKLGIPFEGRMLDFSVSAMIRIHDLGSIKPIEDGERYILFGPEGAWGSMVWVDGDKIWRFSIVGNQEKIHPSHFDIEPEIRRALGSDDVAFDILRIMPWRRSQCVAASYRKGRVLLAGDSAHTTSPTGGHGMNTGLADAVDLAWMLDAIESGWGTDGLLTAYDIERRPVGVRNSASAARNYGNWVDRSGCTDVLTEGPAGDACRKALGERLQSSLQEEWYTLGVELGYRYENSPIIVPDGSLPTADDPSDYVQTARPGHRAPHAWLADGRSTLDLFGQGFTLLRFRDTEAEAGQLVRAAEAVGMPLQLIDIREDSAAQIYQRALVLVRPDGQVAWRGDTLPRDCAYLIDTLRGAHIPSAVGASRAMTLEPCGA
ncbi:FAD-dependent monooxygenase [Sphingobium phenoxybenzoativorans]|uniref:FAD-dependent monooxygenase n=1 Tax=Sphingobium phenoxybenzoativorans TaxID=1592790 RepID=UPI000872C9AC|nr:FAD-dependent monooxygenase [Sphingobium phenoxybenzoativorans]